MRLRLNDQAVLYIEFMVEQHPEKHSSFLPFLCQRYAITGALQLSTTFLQLLKRKGWHKRTRDEWKKFHESSIVRVLNPYRAAWNRMKGAEFCSQRWNPSTDKTIIYSWIRNGKQLWQHRTILSVEPRRQIFVTVAGKSASETTLRHQPWIVRCCPICCGALCCQTVDDSILTANCWRIMHRYEEWRSSNE